MAKALIGLVLAAVLLVLLLGYFLSNNIRGPENIRQPLASPEVKEVEVPVGSLSVREYGEVIMPDSMKKCVVDDDCVWVYSDCGACEVAAMNKRYKSIYEQQRISACRSYYEATEEPQVQCDTVFYGSVRCLDSRCVAVASE